MSINDRATYRFATDSNDSGHFASLLISCHFYRYLDQDSRYRYWDIPKSQCQKPYYCTLVEDKM